jgi:hypothetical protein
MEHDMQMLLAKHQLEGMDPVKVGTSFTGTCAL